MDEEKKKKKTLFPFQSGPCIFFCYLECNTDKRVVFFYLLLLLLGSLSLSLSLTRAASKDVCILVTRCARQQENNNKMNPWAAAAALLRCRPCAPPPFLLFPFGRKNNFKLILTFERNNITKR